MSKQPTAGAANNSSWNDSGFAFPPNTNTMDKESMPSEQAQAARDKAAEIMAALKSGDTQKANALMGKDQSKGKILPGMSWIKKKMNRGKEDRLEGQDVVSSSTGTSVHEDNSTVVTTKNADFKTSV